MATRRLASAPRSGRLISCLLAGSAIVSVSPLPASAQYMALTAPPRPDAARAVAPVAQKPVPPPSRPAEHAFGGQLPNQRIGPARQRVVRDICIGCDR